MKILNNLYNKSCKPGYSEYIYLTKNIILIDNFFENFDLARNFYTRREVWDCIPYQKHSKPGSETIFPSWIGRSLLEKFVLDNKIVDDMNSYKPICNFFYYENQIWSLSNSTYFPHYDSVQDKDVLEHICLINLNDVPVSTKFYTYKNQEHCSSEIKAEWEEYNKDIEKDLLDHYDNKEIITRDELKIFLEQDLRIKLIKEVEYKPNQAIVYPSNLFHSPSISQEFTKDNPRVLLRISFDRKIMESKEIKEVSYA